jgi:N-terminal domain of toast_rack, DUF2154/Domain of unknown function (DUF5668)
MPQLSGPRQRSLVPALILICLGVFFLAVNLRPDLKLDELLLRYWPLLLIAVGVLILLERFGSQSGSHTSGWIIAVIVLCLLVGFSATVHRRISQHVYGGYFAAQHESRTVDAQGAKSVDAHLDLGAGELRLSGGARQLLDAHFDYTAAEGVPEVQYNTSGGTGHLSISQHRGGGVHFGNDENVWDLKFADDVPMDLELNMGAGQADITLAQIEVHRLEAHMGAGEMNLDLSGDWKHDLEGTIHGGVGEATIRLPKDTGVMVHASGGIGSIDAQGLHENGSEYTNDAYGKSAVTIHLNIEGGIGQINLIAPH